MKKILLLTTFALVGLVAQAQGFVGGSMKLQNQTTKNNTITKASIGVEMGRHINHNWALCAGIGYGTNSMNSDLVSSEFEIAPFARYTAARWGAVSLYFDGGVKMNWETTYRGNEETNFSWGMGVSPGLALNLSRRVTFVTNFGFVGYNYAENNEVIGFNFDTSNVRFGFHFNF